MQELEFEDSRFYHKSPCKICDDKLSETHRTPQKDEKYSKSFVNCALNVDDECEKLKAFEFTNNTKVKRTSI